MIETEEFKRWLKDNTQYSDAVISDQVSRMKRADKILPWKAEDTYLYYLEKENCFIELSVYVKSQMRKAVKLYQAYVSAFDNMNK